MRPSRSLLTWLVGWVSKLVSICNWYQDLVGYFVIFCGWFGIQWRKASSINTSMVVNRSYGASMHLWLGTVMLSIEFCVVFGCVFLPCWFVKCLQAIVLHCLVHCWFLGFVISNCNSRILNIFKSDSWGSEQSSPCLHDDFFLS